MKFSSLFINKIFRKLTPKFFVIKIYVFQKIIIKYNIYIVFTVRSATRIVIRK